MTRYLLAGGGTAGHVNPLLAVADKLREGEADAQIFVLGTTEGLEARLVPERGYPLITIPKLPFPRRITAEALAFPLRWRAAVRETRKIIRENSIDLVVGFGGYAAAPAYAAAKREKLRLVIHEANATPGIANRYGARNAFRVGVAFSGTPLRGARLVGLPLRREIETLDRAAMRAESAKFFGLAPDRPVLLVTGGSQGAAKINATIRGALAAVLAEGWQLLHITGVRDAATDSDIPGYRVLPYCDRMDLAFAVCDLAVSRAGAASVSELSALGIPSVFVPYPVGNGEQALNAQDAVRAGGALVVRDADFTGEWVSGHLVQLLGDQARRADMAARMLSVAGRDGAEKMVQLIRDAQDW